MAAAEELDVDAIAVRLSSPGKIYFPELGVDGGTKRHLVEYYRTVALEGSLLRALADRPTYLQRFPDGIEGEEIYQKRIPAKHPEHVATTTVTFPSGRTADALHVRSAANIVWAANLGCITFHPLAQRVACGQNPDELRIDLDPQPGTDFADAARLALDTVVPVLADLEMVGYPKTSGGRGLHIYVRIEPRWSPTEVRRAAIAIARDVAARSPHLATTSWWKEERGARVFIDYNQNALDRTIASAYSVRRTPSATVSTPVTWDELPSVSPEQFTIATVPKRLQEIGDPMVDLDNTSHCLTAALALADEQNAGDLPYPPNYPKMPGEPPRVQPSRARRS